MPGGKLKDVFWDRFIELGTRPHTVGAGSTLGGGKHGSRRQHGAHHPGARKQPFIGESVEATKEAVYREIGKVFRVI
jgi:hypothetical protein